MSEAPGDSGEDRVAIIGMACRMPGAGNAREFWESLVGGVESITSFTEEELLDSGIDPRIVHAPHYVKARGIIGGADCFDAAFFNFTPREAELLDPQQRVFLECAWHALEDGGYVPGDSAGRIAVFGGVGTNWHLATAHRHPDVQKFASPASVVIANDKDYLTTRVSYKLGLTGPSINVQSACSTSLVATIMGMHSLLSYQCDLVLAGGATIEIPEKNGYLYQDGGMESPDGRCRPFDAGANGTVFSRGAGVVLLKRLSAAVADGDHIYAVILDGAINNDGALKLGFTAPGVNGQVEVAIEALERAGVTADTLSFVEAHGTATALGDPIEVASLTQAFRAYTDRHEYCALGSVKGNIGHTDVASGAAGLIKTAMALEHGKLPASLNFDSPNPKIDFPSSPFFVNTGLLDLERNGAPRRALINSFGVGGTNACAVLQEPPARARPRPRREEKLLLLSARTADALERLTDSMRAHVESHPDADLDAIAYTCQVGRRAFAHRRAVAFTGRDELIERLSPEAAGLTHAVCETEGRPVVFAFPGQGNQYVGMGRDLYEGEPVYRDVVDAAREILRPILGADLAEVMYASGESAADAAALLDQTRFTQPALFVTSCATARLLMSWGVRPAAMVGHSVGEYVAGHLAGVLSFEDALTAVAHRGKLIQALPRGSMLAVLLSEQDTTPLLSPGLAVAAVNGPQLTVVSGPTPEIAGLEQRLGDSRVFCRRLDTSHAFHSAMMDPALPEFGRLLADVPLAAPALPIASTLTGTWLTAEDATSPEYWVTHMRRPVRFFEAVQTLLEPATPSILLECGPGHSLMSAARHQVDANGPHAVIGSMRAEGEAGSDVEWLLKGGGALWMAGTALDWPAIYGDRLPGRVPLPGYPFERQRFSLDLSKREAAVVAARDDEKRPDVRDWFYVPGWKRTPGPGLVGATNRDGADPGGRVWLVFEDDLGLAVEVHALVQRAGEEVIGVRAGDRFQKVDDRTFSIRPGVRADYDELFSALKASARWPDRLLHLWNVDGDEQPPSLERVERSEAVAFYSPLFIEQALVNHGPSGNVRMLVAADGVLDVTGERVTCPAKALAIGPCRVVGKEVPAVHARFVDVVAPQVQGAAPALAEQLVRELERDGDETVVAYRGDHRWVESYDAVQLDAADGLTSRLREDGVYLITGGLGGLGLFFAREIAERVTSRLVLTHRSPLPARDAWPAWLEEHGPDDPTSERLRGVLGLEEAGATVMLAEADCADLAAMDAVVRDAEAAFGPISGVIHAAGLPGEGIISLKSEEMAADVLAPKVRGTLVLDRLFADAELDFLLLFSSITSVLGEAGRVDYCAANNFMDALAHHYHRDGRPAVASIGWGAWGHVGMAARWEATKELRGRASASTTRDQDGPRMRLVSETDGQEVYDVLLDPDHDWVIGDHSIGGVPTVVGTTYLELIHELAELKRSGASPVVERMSFSSPLMFPPDASKRIRLFVEEEQGKHRFAFKSQVTNRERAGIWHEHCAGEARLGGGDPRARVDVAAVLARCGRVDTRRFNRLPDGGATLALGERWDCLEAVHIGADEWLARLELPARFAGDLSRHAFHPAMMDVALAAAAWLVSEAGDGAFYLPFEYGAVQLKARYPAAVWSHISKLASEPDSDALSFEVAVLDEEGWELATVGRYTLMKVSSALGSGEEAPKRPAQVQQTSEDILPAEGLDALKRILGAPLQPQVVVSASSLDARIEEAAPGGGAADGDPGSPETAPSVYARPSLSTPYEEPASEVERTISEIWEGILGIGEIGANDHFTELGGNSLLAVQAAATISDTYQLELSVEAFLGNPTVRGVADTVVGLLVSLVSGETLESMLADLEG